MEWGFGGRLRQAHTVMRVRHAHIPRQANTTMTVMIAKVLSGGGAWIFETHVDTVAGVRYCPLQVVVTVPILTVCSLPAKQILSSLQKLHFTVLWLTQAVQPSREY